MKAMVCVLVMLASGGAAQEAQVDRGLVAACFEAGRAGTGAQTSCIGDAAARCQDRPGGQTTLGIAECLMAETAIWADFMKVALERKAQAFGQQAPGLSQSLAGAQEAWVAYRDAECGLRYEVWIEGSIRTIIAGQCHLQMTAARALEVATLGDME